MISQVQERHIFKNDDYMIIILLYTYARVKILLLFVLCGCNTKLQTRREISKVAMAKNGFEIT